MNIHVVALVVSVAIFLFVIDLVRRRRLTFKYAVAGFWFPAGRSFLRYFTVCFLPARPCLVLNCPAIYFFALFCVFVFLSLLLTVFLCQQNNRNDVMAQKIALLEFELKELKKKLKVDHDPAH